MKIGFGVLGVLGVAGRKGVLLLFNKEDISKMRKLLTEDWIKIPEEGK